MRKINRMLAMSILVLSIIGITISMGVICSYASIDYNKEINVVNNTTENSVYLEKKESKTEYVSTKKQKESVKQSNVAKNEYSEEWLQEFNKKVAELQQKYPKGYYWNHAGNGKNLGVTTVPCDHKNGKCYCNVYDSKSTKACGFKVGRQCAGFASILSDEVFGKDAPVRIFYNYDEIRVGDQARINNNSHTVFIIEKTDDYVVVAECNADYKTCVINWGRKIPRNQLKGYYITRWQ
jgi:hypothetical protein